MGAEPPMTSSRPCELARRPGPDRRSELDRSLPPPGRALRGTRHDQSAQWADRAQALTRFTQCEPRGHYRYATRSTMKIAAGGRRHRQVPSRRRIDDPSGEACPSEDLFPRRWVPFFSTSSAAGRGNLPADARPVGALSAGSARPTASRPACPRSPPGHGAPARGGWPSRPWHGPPDRHIGLLSHGVCRALTQLGIGQWVLGLGYWDSTKTSTWPASPDRLAADDLV